MASPSDDLYAGYNDYPSAFSTKDLDQDEIFQQALRTSYGRRPVVSCMIVVLLQPQNLFVVLCYDRSVEMQCLNDYTFMSCSYSIAHI